MPSIFHPIVPTSIQSQVVLPSVKCGWFLCWCHLFEEYVSARVLKNLFEAHCVCTMNRVVSDGKRSCSGECFRFVCFVLFMSDICLQMLNRFIAVGYGQVKGSIIDKRETVLTVQS